MLYLNATPPSRSQNSNILFYNFSSKITSHVISGKGYISIGLYGQTTYI